MGGFYRGEWGTSKYFSSNETEEEAMPYKMQSVDIQDNDDSKKLVEVRVKNQLFDLTCRTPFTLSHINRQYLGE